MRNFGEGLFFTKEIMVMKSDMQLLYSETPEPEIDLQFLPEGGDLVYGIESKVAFRSTTEIGNGIDVNFKIYNQNDEFVSKGESMFRGMGSLYFTPKKGESYYAVIDNYKLQKRYPLPEILDRGYALQVDRSQQGNSYMVTIKRSENFINGEKVTLAVQSGGKLFHCWDININSPRGNILIPDNSLPEGISSLVLFNESGIPVAERLVFNDSFNKINVKVTTIENEKNINDVVKFVVETSDSKGDPIPANLSISVTEKFMSESVSPSGFNIFSQILLNSDLRGKIEDPDYYFSEENPKRKEHLDLLMLTNGWRRYVWSNVSMKKDVSLPFAFENGFGFSGRVRKLFFDKPVIKAKTTLSIINKGFYFNETVTDEYGEFKFDDVLLYDSTHVIVQSYNKKGKKKSLIEFQQNRYDGPPVNFKSRLYKTNSDSTLYTDYAAQALAVENQQNLMTNKNILLEDITVRASKIDKNISEIRFYGEADYVLEEEDLESATIDIFDVLEGKVAGLRVSGTCPEVEISVRGGSKVVYLLDERDTDLDYICDISPTDIKSLEVLTGVSAMAFGGADAVIAVYMKRGAELRVVEDPIIGISKFCADGYYRARQPYKPKYEAPVDNFSPDVKTTLFWLPYVVTDSLGRAEVSYLNSHKEAEYDIIIEGTGIKSGLAHETISYKTSY
jgi:hypothetical protein